MKRFFILFFVVASVAVAMPVHADTLGEQRTFAVDPLYDAQGRSQAGFILRLVSAHAYWYVADEYGTDLDTSLAALGREFDETIYPKETAFFGSEANPGLDGDPRVLIMLASLKSNIGGYFDPSGNREAIFLNGVFADQTTRLSAFIAHEFQHLISYNQRETLRRTSDDTWINELRSEYAPTLAGYVPPGNTTLQRRVDAFFENPSDSLTEWKNLSADYGAVAVLGEYLADRWSSRVIADTLQAGIGGSIASMNEALAKNGFRESFHDVFAHWLTAGILNDVRSDVRHGYSSALLADRRVTPTKLISDIADGERVIITGTVKDWQPQWYDLQNFTPGSGSRLDLSVTSPALSRTRLPYLVFKNDGTAMLQVAPIGEGMATFSISGIGTGTNRLVLMPYQFQKIEHFTADEPSTPLTITIQRESTAATPNPPLAGGPTPSPSPSSHPTPEQFGLHEGDFIRAEGDHNIYIINQYGYKRLVLSPAICLQYGHLGARGCFDAVRVVTPAVRDAFITSHRYSNGETRDGKVYRLIITGEDSAVLELVAHPLDNAVFFINTREQGSYF